MKTKKLEKKENKPNRRRKAVVSIINPNSGKKEVKTFHEGKDLWINETDTYLDIETPVSANTANKLKKYIGEYDDTPDGGVIACINLLTPLDKDTLRLWKKYK